ncbi:hypothetical protein J4H86_15265 [Spiractinospora alimapuensis]|uniref:hypothetical protein n=1 Tax=Spiractinospora alimapuensis TaxID=2820884 RepID=UPI001F198DE9|nr:hypothetical protein [Spiractinospora alimapuensis]QVQ50307.1 hypothetical protein J4H86_15265 [Spiractinospora alimapuensis]
MMLLIELYLPSGVLGAPQRERLARRLIAFMDEDEHSPTVLEDSRALTQVLLLEPQTWVAGDRTVSGHDNARYVARVSVPAPWVKPVREEMVQRFTRIIREAAREADADADPRIWVEIRGVRDGSWGMDGQTLSTPEIERLVTQRRREEVRGRVPVPGPRPATVHDPICDMVVELDDAAITLVHAGETYGYCTKACRARHAEELGAAI